MGNKVLGFFREYLPIMLFVELLLGMGLDNLFILFCIKDLTSKKYMPIFIIIFIIFIFITYNFYNIINYKIKKD